MNNLVYDIANFIGLIFIGAGVAMISVPAAFVVVGALIIFLTILGRFLWLRRP